MNTSIAENFIRSANAPTIRAGVMIANVNWYIMNTVSGIVPLIASTVRPFRNALPKPPMTAFPSPNARL